MSAASIVVLATGCLLLLGLVAWERGAGGGKEVALVATLGAAAAAGRVLFAAIPSVKPVTVMCLVTGAVLGARAGMAVGAIAALASNVFLGLGPWTLPQMILWGLVGVSGALLRDVVRRPVGLCAVGAVWGFVFGWGMNVWFLSSFGPELSPAALVTAGVASLWFDSAHAIGNVVFALVIGLPLLRLLERYSTRIRVSFAPTPGVSPP